MTHEDGLGRNPHESFDTQIHLDSLKVLNITLDDWLLSIQLTDPKICFTKDVINDPKYDEIIDIKQNFVIKLNRLFRKENGEIK